jgi:glycolate oxidase FAD binding subunit
MSDSITIDGVGPMPLLRPTSAAEVGEVVRRAVADGTAIYPVGGGTMLDYGLPPARPGVAVELRALDKVIDFPARDMTITVEAGITIAKLDEIVRAEGLHLPIDVPNTERATLGGAIACNVSGPRRFGYGTFRDYVLGITTVNDHGEQVSAGGRVVKNVAGYDLMKLHTGALGTLGVITQVTLRLKPVTEARGMATFGCREPLSAMLDLLHRSQTRPVIIDVMDGESGFVPDSPNPSKDSACPWQVFVGFEGSSEVVAWQVEQLCREVEPSDPQRLLRFLGPAAELHYRLLTSHNAAASDSPRLRVSITPSGVASFLVDALQSDHDVWTHAQAGNGAVRVGFSGQGARENATMFGEPVNSLLGRAPPADLALQKAVKRALDPQNIFNPGRFVTDAF